MKSATYQFELWDNGRWTNEDAELGRFVKALALSGIAFSYVHDPKNHRSTIIITYIGDFDDARIHRGEAVAQ